MSSDTETELINTQLELCKAHFWLGSAVGIFEVIRQGVAIGQILGIEQHTIMQIEILIKEVLEGIYSAQKQEEELCHQKEKEA